MLFNIFILFELIDCLFSRIKLIMLSISRFVEFSSQVSFDKLLLLFDKCSLIMLLLFVHLLGRNFSNRSISLLIFCKNNSFFCLFNFVMLFWLSSFMFILFCSIINSFTEICLLEEGRLKVFIRFSNNLSELFSLFSKLFFIFKFIFWFLLLS